MELRDYKRKKETSSLEDGEKRDDNGGDAMHGRKRQAVEQKWKKQSTTKTRVATVYQDLFNDQIDR